VFGGVQVREINEMYLMPLGRQHANQNGGDADSDRSRRRQVADNGIDDGYHTTQHQQRAPLTDTHVDLRKKVVSDRKATMTLASVVAAFGVCWVPYFVLFTAKPFLSCHVNPHLETMVTWLGYCNSTVNPFLYAFYSSAFRRGFSRVLLCRR
jgi:hypothetical protein